MMPSSFDGIPFAAGSMVGLRAFSVTDAEPDVLRGISYRSPFEPGINEAVHRTVDDSPVPADQLTADHKVAMLNCTCGFWAYYNGHNTASSPKGVAAVVEGFGRVTYGTEGFRASKMRLLGIIGEAYMRVMITGCTCAVCSGKIIRRPQLKKIAERYGVPLYDTHADATAAHPLTKPPAAEPPAPTDGVTLTVNGVVVPATALFRPGSRWYFG